MNKRNKVYKNDITYNNKINTCNQITEFHCLNMKTNSIFNSTFCNFKSVSYVLKSK